MESPFSAHYGDSDTTEADTVTQLGPQHSDSDVSDTETVILYESAERSSVFESVIFLDGYQLTRSRRSSVKASYRCSFYRRTGCTARVEFFATGGGYKRVRPHTCSVAEVLEEEETVVHVEEQMKREIDRIAVENPSESALSVWNTVNSMFYQREDGKAAIGLTRDQVVGRVYSTRRAHYGGDIHGVIEVPPLSMVVGTTLRFFQFHHIYYEPRQKKPNEPQRIIGWAHPELIKLLMYKSITVFIDGTFRCVPTKFHQCVIVMVMDSATDLFIPVFYVLCTGKTQDTYWNVINSIVQCTNEKFDPGTVVCDFEAALINAVAVQFPDATLVGCYFHFKQALRRKMKAMSLPAAEITIAMQRGVLDILTVIKRKHIIKKGIAHVKTTMMEKCAAAGISYSSGKWRSFWAYFIKTWIRKYKPASWNVHGLDHAIVSRTNNPLERFNRELNEMFSTPHPTLPTFVGKIESLARKHVQLRQDTPVRVHRRQRQPVVLPAAVEFETSDEESEDERIEDSGQYSSDSSNDEETVEDTQVDMVVEALI